jgi:hypothetical protein
MNKGEARERALILVLYYRRGGSGRRKNIRMGRHLPQSQRERRGEV